MNKKVRSCKVSFDIDVSMTIVKAFAGKQFYSEQVLYTY